MENCSIPTRKRVISMKTWLIGVQFLDHTKICSILWIDWSNLHP